MSKIGNTVPPTRAEQVAMLQGLINGLAKNEPAISSLLIQGKTHFVGELIARLQERLDATQAVATTRAAWQNAVKNDHTQRETTNAFVSSLKQALLAGFSGQVDTLADFGLVGRKPRAMSPEAKVVAAQRAKATRIARHTLGKNQKAAIKGNVTGVVITPTAGASSSVTVTPATSAAPATTTSPAPPHS